MCGIAGYITKDGKKPAVNARQMADMLIRAMSRGTHATGIFWESETQNKIFKLPVDAKTFAPKVPWADVLKSPVCLMHTRHATQGNPSTNSNNHPLIDGDIVLTHNGVIHNSYEFVSNEITDSFAIIEAYQQAKNKKDTFAMGMKKGLKLLSGSIACAMYRSGKLLLVKSGNPLFLGFKGNTIFWASTRHILNAVKPDYIVEVPGNYMYSISNNNFKGYAVATKGGDNNGREWFEFGNKAPVCPTMGERRLDSVYGQRKTARKRSFWNNLDVQKRRL